MQKFAKLFETEDYGQLLLMMNNDEKGNPETTLYFTAEGLAVCSISVYGTVNASDAAFELVEKLFNRFDESAAIKTVKTIVDQLSMYD